MNNYCYWNIGAIYAKSLHNGKIIPFTSFSHAKFWTSRNSAIAAALCGGKMREAEKLSCICPESNCSMSTLKLFKWSFHNYSSFYPALDKYFCYLQVKWALLCIPRWRKEARTCPHVTDLSPWTSWNRSLPLWVVRWKLAELRYLLRLPSLWRDGQLSVLVGVFVQLR